MSDRYEDILDFCRNVTEEAQNADGSVSINPRKASLINAGYNIQSFSYDEFRAACVGLSYTSVYRGMNMILGNDHRILWDTVGRHLLEPSSLYFNEDPNQGIPKEITEEYRAFRSLFVATIKTTTHEWMLFQQHPLSDWSGVQRPPGAPIARFQPAGYLVYPLLEAVLKESLSDYLDRDGTVTEEFQIGRKRPYSPGDEGRNRCSSVSDMLRLLDQQDDRPNLNHDLRLIYEHISSLYDGDYATNVIANKWRNPAIHGENHIPTAYGVLLNIVLLIAMDDTEERLRQKLSASS
jgi:hypothetical protein